MGRWENTKKIQPFKGVYLYGERKPRNSDKERIREVQQAKKREATENNCEKATLAKQQNLADEYGVPQTQAQVEVTSVAEEIDKVRPQQPEPMDTISDKDRLLAVLRKHGYETEEEWRAELKRRSDRRRSWFTDKQLSKLANELGVDWYETQNKEILFLDDTFQEVLDDFYGSLDDMVGKSFGEKKAIIKDWYEDQLRDPYKFGDYERMQRMMIEHYGLKETYNKNGVPIGKFGKYIRYYDDVYDNWRRCSIYPDFEDVIEGMDEIIETTKIDNRAKKYQRKKEFEEWKRKQEQEPARIISQQYMPHEGLPFTRS